MRRLPYLIALLVMTALPILAPAARAQDQTAKQADEEAPGSIVFSGNGQTATGFFDLEAGLAVVSVSCVSGGATSATVVTGAISSEADTSTIASEAHGDGVVEARAGGAEARVGGGVAEARAGGAIARSGGRTAATTFRQTISSSLERTENQGDTNCIVRLLDENGARVGGDNLANETSFFLPQGSSQAVRTKAGRHVLDVQANGPWTVNVGQPHPSSAPRTTRFSGDGETATDFFRLSRGPKRFEMTHRGDGKFSVRLLDKNGSKVGARLVNRKGPFDGTRSLRVPEDGIYLLQVEANGPWAIRLK